MKCWMLHHVILSFTTLKYRYLMHPQQITQCVCCVITVLYPGIVNQMHTFRESLILANGRTGKEEIRTPQHKTHCDQFEKRQFSSSGKSCQPSRSQSPSQRNNSGTSQHRSSPPPYSHLHLSSSSSPSKQLSFQQGTGSNSPTVCTLCLGQDACNMLKCQSNTFWDGSKARCQKNNQG